jgi:hypothetical protein
MSRRGQDLSTSWVTPPSNRSSYLHNHSKRATSCRTSRVHPADVADRGGSANAAERLLPATMRRPEALKVMRTALSRRRHGFESRWGCSVGVSDITSQLMATKPAGHELPRSVSHEDGTVMAMCARVRVPGWWLGAVGLVALSSRGGWELVRAEAGSQPGRCDGAGPAPPAF